MSSSVTAATGLPRGNLRFSLCQFSPHAGRRCFFPIWCSFDKTLLRKKLLGDSPKPSSRICLQLRGPRKRSHRQSNGNPFEQTFLRVHTWNTARGKGCSNSILVQIPNHEVRIIPPVPCDQTCSPGSVLEWVSLGRFQCRQGRKNGTKGQWQPAITHPRLASRDGGYAGCLACWKHAERRETPRHLGTSNCLH